MSWKEGFGEALFRFLKDRADDAIQLIDYETDTEDRGYCETCSYSVTIVRFTYRDRDDRIKYYEWEGNFPELISALGEWHEIRMQMRVDPGQGRGPVAG